MTLNDKLQTQYLYDFIHHNSEISSIIEYSYYTSGDVGGQKTLRSYWRNYFEKTDALIWVVDATDRLRMEDCREELAGLLLEEVSRIHLPSPPLCKVIVKTNIRLALDGRKFVGLCEQDRCWWMHDR